MTDINNDTPIEETVEETVDPEVEVKVEEETSNEDVTEEKETEEEEEVIDPEKITIETRGKDEEPVDYGADIDPDDAKTIGSIVEKQTAGVKKQLQDTADRLEVDAFIQEKPEFSKYKSTILKYVQHPVYSKIPVKNIAAMVASDDLLKIGAKKEREAQARADSTKSAGTQVRKPEGGSKDWKTASKQEFEEQKRRVLGQQV